MKTIHYFLISFFLLLFSCKKNQLKKFEGDYKLVSANCAGNSLISIKSVDTKYISFNFKFGCYTTKRLNAKVGSSKTAFIDQATIGVLSQGPYLLFGGTITRKERVLIIELDMLNEPDPNDHYIKPGPDAIRHIETYTYIKV
ncbi:MAG: hypothetical protein ABL940_10160 [Bacteroidia bacterium]